MIGLRHGATLLIVQLDPDGRGRCDFARETLIGECAIRVAMAGPAADYIHCHPNEKAFSLADCNASTGDFGGRKEILLQLPTPRATTRRG